MYILPEETLSCNNISQWLTLRWAWQNPRRVSFVLFQPFPKQWDVTPSHPSLSHCQLSRTCAPPEPPAPPPLVQYYLTPKHTQLSIYPVWNLLPMFNYSGCKLHRAWLCAYYRLSYAVSTYSGHNKSCIGQHHERLDSAFRGSVILPQTLSLPPLLMKPSVGSYLRM